MIKKIILLVIMCFFSACEKNNSSEHSRLASQFMNRFISHAQKQHRLICFGSGGGFMEQVNQFDLSFCASGEKSIEEFRILMVFVVNDFLKQINSDEKIKPFLAEYPFPANRLTLSISLLGNDRKPLVNKGNKTSLLTDSFLIKGKIYYYANNEKKGPMHTQHSETYEEAYNIVNKQLPGMLTSERAW